jgi:histone H3/H4
LSFDTLCFPPIRTHPDRVREGRGWKGKGKGKGCKNWCGTCLPVPNTMSNTVNVNRVPARGMFPRGIPPPPPLREVEMEEEMEEEDEQEAGPGNLGPIPGNRILPVGNPNSMGVPRPVRRTYLHNHRSIPNAAIRRLARSAGITRLSNTVYERIRTEMSRFLTRIMTDACIFSSNRGRRDECLMVSPMDIIHALRRDGHTVYR